MSQTSKNNLLGMLHLECQGSTIKISSRIILSKHTLFQPHGTITTMGGIQTLMPQIISHMILLTSTSAQITVE